MLTKEQLHKLSRQYKTNEYVVAREFLQILFLKELYAENFSENIFFKGGTCIRLIYGGTRFSEDLDFTVMLDEEDFEGLIEKFFKKLENTYPIKFKKKDVFVGKTYLAKIKLESLKQEVNIKLDFSFRENVIEGVQERLSDNKYPIVFRTFVNCLSKDEMFAEKIRAFLNREKYRDLYDLWYLLDSKVEFKADLVQKKLNYYDIKYDKSLLEEKLKNMDKEKFVQELRPFVPIQERDNLGKLFEYICEYIKKEMEFL